ncbi:MAG: FliM/FliN family flagellar motor switch protein [Acidobacteriota bacterium]
MTTLLQPIVHRPWRLLPPGYAGNAQDWTQALARPTQQEQEAARLHGAVQRQAHLLPTNLADHLAAILRASWCIQSGPSLQFTLRPQGGGSRNLRISSPVVRIGHSAACHIQLPGKREDDEYCEVRVEDDGLWLIHLGRHRNTMLNGYQLSTHERRPLVVGDEIALPTHRLQLDDWRPPSEDLPVDLRFQHVELIRGDDAPFTRLGNAGEDRWIRVKAGDWHGHLRLPTTWLQFAYATLATAEPSVAPGLDNPLDRAITHAVLQRIARELSERCSAAVSLDDPRPADQLVHDEGAGAHGWFVAYFDVDLGGHAAEAISVWPIDPARLAPPTRTPLVDALPFQLTVDAGVVTVDRDQVDTLEPGDILIPDRWLPTPQADQPVTGPVHLSVQGWRRVGQLAIDGDAVQLAIDEAGWTLAPKGDAPMLNNPAMANPSAQNPQQGGRGQAQQQAQQPQQQAGGGAPAAGGGAGASVPEALEVVLTFELDRLTLPLKDLASWQQGATVALSRKPHDPVRIMLHHAGGSQQVGEGRVVLLDDTLGVRIEDWYSGES